MNPNTKKLLGALVAAALAIAAFYGVISQQQATSLQNQANQTLGTGPANAPTQPAPQQTTQQTAQPMPQAAQPAPSSPAPQTTQQTAPR